VGAAGTGHDFGRPWSSPAWLAVALPAAVSVLGMQVWTGDPLGELMMAGVGVVGFSLFISSYASWSGCRNPVWTRSFPAGILLGMAVDVAVRGAFLTYDLSWQSGLPAMAVGIGEVLVCGLIVAAWLSRSGRKSDEQVVGVDHCGGVDSSVADAQAIASPAWGWFVLGPFLVLELLILGNQARLAVLTGWEPFTALAVMGLAHVGAVAAAGAFRVWTKRSWVERGAVPLAVVAVVLATIPGSPSPLWAAVGVLAGAVAGGTLLASAYGGRAGRGAFGAGIGLVVMVVLLFAYYGSYDLALPFPRESVPPLAAVMLALGALGGIRGEPHFHHTDSGDRRLRGRAWGTGRIVPGAVGVTVVLLVIPVVGILLWEAPGAAEPEGGTVRVMTYNLHNGFNTEGALDPEALARTIEDAAPDVVALQEVSRGWVINGSFDLLSWLAHRLDMVYVYGLTSGPLWGNVY